MTAPLAQDYRLSDADAATLCGIVSLPHDLRARLLEMVPADQLVDLFAQFIGLANSVVANNRTMAEHALVNVGKIEPHVAARMNLPTIIGALWGVKLARAAAGAKKCAGCAYRHASPANQSPTTTCDAQFAEAGEFFCHEDMDATGEPAHQCRGHAMAKARAP